MSDKKFYVTTPIYYVNARPHIGHAYTTIVADVLARRHRLLGEDTFFLTGTDEHGQKIERSAAAANIPPQQFADQVSKSFEDLWHRMGITNNDYIRTTSDKHKRGVQHLFSELYKNGFIYLASYTGSYCVSDETFVDAPVGTPCPDCGRLLEEVTEENFFFKLSAFQRPLIELIQSNTISITPESRRNEVLSFLCGDFRPLIEEYKQANSSNAFEENIDKTSDEEDIAPAGRSESLDAIAWGILTDRVKSVGQDLHYVPGALKDLSISRSSFTWGIPVPEPAASAASQKHVIYVWLDALANYMTAIGYGSDDPAEQAKFQKFWPANLHLVGKEIIRFHCVYWPAFLLALNPKLQHQSNEKPPTLSLEEHKAWAKDWLPQAITAHGWLLFDDSKMSKSKGNIVRTETILDAFGTLCPPPPPIKSGDATNQVPQGFSLGSHSDEKNAGALAPETALKGTGFSPSVPPPPADPALAAEGLCPTPTKADRDLFASDVLRYFLLREIPFGQDGSFTFDALITRYNADLANGYGNLVSRTLKLIADHFKGSYPGHAVWEEKGIVFVERIAGRRVIRNPHAVKDTELATLADVVAHFCQSAFSSLRFSLAVDRERLLQDMRSGTELEDNERGALDLIMLLLSRTDELLSELQPWKLLKSGVPEDRDKASDCLYQAAESIRIITALLYPILPYATARVWAQLGLGSIEQAAANGKLANLTWGGLQPGTKLGPLGPIFPRADKGLAQIMTDMENPLPHLSENPQRLVENELRTSTTDPAAPPRSIPLPDHGPLPVAGSTAHTTGPDPTLPAPPTTDNQQPTTPQITIDDFAKIELRVAQILLAERIPKADKLLRLEVDLGPHGQRQILSGIAEFYTPEELTGRRIVVITNLAPRKMRGLESHGMLLAASDGDHGKPHLATCGDEIPLGSRLK